MVTYWTPPRLWRLAELIEQGWSDAEIGREFGKSAASIDWARRTHGIASRTETAYSVRRVAAILGIGCQKTVSRWIAKGWLRARRGPVRGRYAQYMVQRDDLLAFLENPEHWHRWEPARIASESDLRWWATEMRAGVRYLTVAEVAARCCVQERTVSYWIASGQLPAVRGRSCRVRADALEGFVAPGQRSRAGGRTRRFSPGEDVRLLTLRASGHSWPAIARQMGRAESSLCVRYRRLMEREETAA